VRAAPSRNKEHSTATSTGTSRNSRRTRDKDLDVDQNLDARDGDPDDTDETYQAFVGNGSGRVQRGARRELRAGTESGRDAIRRYGRAWNDGVSAFLPPAPFRPGEAIRSTFDVLGQAVELQQAFWDEMAGVRREDLLAVARDTRDDRRSDIRYEEHDYSS